LDFDRDTERADVDYESAVRHAKLRRERTIRQAKEQRDKRIATLDIRMAELCSQMDVKATAQPPAMGARQKQLRQLATSGTRSNSVEQVLMDRRTSM
jgi:hypothetical protein